MATKKNADNTIDHDENVPSSPEEKKVHTITNRFGVEVDVPHDVYLSMKAKNELFAEGDTE